MEVVKKKKKVQFDWCGALERDRQTSLMCNNTRRVSREEEGGNGTFSTLLDALPVKPSKNHLGLGDGGCFRN
jgi:hypothetical protein